MTVVDLEQGVRYNGWGLTSPCAEKNLFHFVSSTDKKVDGEYVCRFCGMLMSDGNEYAFPKMLHVPTNQYVKEKLRLYITRNNVLEIGIGT